MLTPSEEGVWMEIVSVSGKLDQYFLYCTFSWDTPPEDPDWMNMQELYNGPCLLTGHGETLYIKVYDFGEDVVTMIPFTVPDG